MCGRTACTLAPDDVVKACTFRSRQGRRQRPVWKDAPGSQKYWPSHNVAPASHTPVVMSSRHCPELESLSERVVQPMKWGLVPKWHKGDPYKVEYETNNCRAEGMLTKKTYKGPLERGNRCVILADGFFEWKRSKEGKQPYFIYFPQDKKPDVKTEVKPDPDSKDVKPKLEPVVIKQDPEKQPIKREKPDPKDLKPKLEAVHVKPDPDNGSKPDSEKLDSDSCNQPINREHDDGDGDWKPGCSKKVKTEVDDDDEFSSGGKTAEKCRPACTSDKLSASGDAGDDVEEWTGKRLLTMAGVFEVWNPPDGSDPLYSYSVITVDASPAMSWIHDRMPAILSTEEEIHKWLDFAEVPLKEAVKMIKPMECITTHMVSPIVNNSRNKSTECVEPYNPKEVKKTASSNLMMNWLSKAKPSPQKQQTPDPKTHK